MLSQNLPTFVLDFFFLLNLICFSISGFIIFNLLKGRPYLLIKPSFILLIYFFIFFQIPFLYFSFEVETFLPNPYIFFFFFYTIIFIGLYISSITFNKEAKNIWKNLTRNSPTQPSLSVAFVSFCLTLICFLIYSLYVDLSQTPLMQYINGENKKVLELSREYSLKTLESPFPRYAYAIARSCFVSFIVSYSAFNFVEYLKYKKYLFSFICAFFIIFAIIFSMIVLNKSSAIFTILPIFMNLFYLNILSYRKILIIFLSSITASFSGLCFFSGSVFSANEFNLLISLKSVFIRTFITPFRVGIWYVHFAQKFDTVGLASYLKVAPFFGIEPIDVPNFIGKLYAPIYYNHPVLESISCTAGFIFANYLAWGLWALPVILLMIIFLDIGLKLIESLSKEYLIPFLSIITIKIISLTASDYGVTIITHGYLISFIFLYVFLKMNKYFESSHSNLKSFKILQKI